MAIEFWLHIYVSGIIIFLCGILKHIISGGSGSTSMIVGAILMVPFSIIFYYRPVMGMGSFPLLRVHRKKKELQKYREQAVTIRLNDAELDELLQKIKFVPDSIEEIKTNNDFYRFLLHGSVIAWSFLFNDYQYRLVVYWDHDCYARLRTAFRNEQHPCNREKLAAILLEGQPRYSLIKQSAIHFDVNGSQKDYKRISTLDLNEFKEILKKEHLLDADIKVYSFKNVED